ncbi:MAG: hypothetical protein ACQEP4_08070 [Bacillota bacterium]
MQFIMQVMTREILHLEQTKGAICYIGNGMDYPPLHSYEYDFPDEIVQTGVDLFKELAGVE